ncbi:MAG: response regulator [Anaerolineae bacterium]
MPTILCVDDEPTQIILLDFAFKRAGFTVVCAHNGQEAVELARRHHPDIILMDLMMPVKDGASATADLKAIPSLADTPIILFTAYETGDLARKALAAGAQEIISKTTPPAKLVSKINQALGR